MCQKPAFLRQGNRVYLSVQRSAGETGFIVLAESMGCRGEVVIELLGQHLKVKLG